MTVVIKSRTTGWAVHVARIEKKRKNTGFCRKPEKPNHLEHITMNSIKVDLKEIGWEGTN
jgi:glycogen synthase